MAVCYYLQGNYHAAKMAITKAIEIAPKNLEYFELKRNVDEQINRGWRDWGKLYVMMTCLR